MSCSGITQSPIPAVVVATHTQHTQSIAPPCKPAPLPHPPAAVTSIFPCRSTCSQLLLPSSSCTLPVDHSNSNGRCTRRLLRARTQQRQEERTRRRVCSRQVIDRPQLFPNLCATGSKGENSFIQLRAFLADLLFICFFTATSEPGIDFAADSSLNIV